VVIVIVLALVVKGCQSSATKNSIVNYNAAASQLITASDNNGSQNVFKNLESGELTSTNGVASLQAQLITAAKNARAQLTQAQSLNPPGQLSGAQTALVQTMQLRKQAIESIAANIQDLANKSRSRDAVSNIAVATSMLYGSDVIYKTFVTTAIAKALNSAGIPLGTGAGEQQINSGQIVPDLGWLQTNFITAKTGAQLSTSAANANNTGPGLHGHSLGPVSVDGTELSTTATNTIAAGSAPTFTLSVTNGGDYNEFRVECKVSVEGLSDTGTATIPETIKGQTSQCKVTLPSPPPSGTPWQVTASIAKVPGETNIANNSATYTITFN
jgi:hypothetical protein